MKSQKKIILQGVTARRRGIFEDFIAHASKKAPWNFQIETRKKISRITAKRKHSDSRMKEGEKVCEEEITNRA